MKVFQKTKKYLVALFSAVALALISFSPVSADELPKQRIQISPAIQDVGDLRPGEKYNNTFKIQNTGTENISFTLGVSPYFVVDEEYSPDFTTENQYTDITNWIKLSQETGTVEPNGEVEIAYTISVPADVPAGGQYALLYAELKTDSSSSSNTGIAPTQRVGMKLYSNVEGNTRRTGSVIENKIPSFLFNPPVSATSIVENTGNTHTSAKYTLQVFPLFGNEEVYTNEENPNTLTILPDTRRLNTVTWEGAPALGIFRVKQTVTIFDETSTTEKLVFLCPIWFLFIVLLIIFCIIFWIVSRIRSRNR